MKTHHTFIQAVTIYLLEVKSRVFRAIEIEVNTSQKVEDNQKGAFKTTINIGGSREFQQGNNEFAEHSMARL